MKKNKINKEYAVDFVNNMLELRKNDVNFDMKTYVKEYVILHGLNKKQTIKLMYYVIKELKTREININNDGHIIKEPV